MEERRSFKRVEYDRSIRCNIASDGWMDDAITRTANISGGGLRVVSHNRLNPEQNLALELHVPGYFRSICARGQVRWSDAANESCVSGIKFTDIDSYDRQLILDYVHFS